MFKYYFWSVIYIFFVYIFWYKLYHISNLKSDVLETYRNVTTGLGTSQV